MRIQMLVTLLGNPDSCQQEDYHAGREYDLPNDLAVAYLSSGCAEVAAKKSKEPDAKKVMPEETKEV